MAIVSTLDSHRYESDPLAVRQTGQLYVPSPHLQVLEFATDCPTRNAGCGLPTCRTRGCPGENPIPFLNFRLKRISEKKKEWKRAKRAIDYEGTGQSEDVLYNQAKKLTEELLWEYMTYNPMLFFTAFACPAPCERNCANGHNPVPIKRHERILLDYARELSIDIPSMFHQAREEREQGLLDKHVVIIGSGPAGLSAAQHLSLIYKRVTIIDSGEFGGMLRYGIPHEKFSKEGEDSPLVAYRHVMNALDVNIKENTKVTPESLKEILPDTDLLFMGLGAWMPRVMQPINGISGKPENLVYAMDVLVNAYCERYDHEKFIPELSMQDKHVVIRGYGATTQDLLFRASAAAQHAKSVTVILGADDVDQERIVTLENWVDNAAADKGDHGDYGRDMLEHKSSPVPTEILKYATITNGIVSNDKIRAVRAQYRVDDSTIERPIPCDILISSIGFHCAEPTLPSVLGLDFDDIGRIVTDDDGFAGIYNFDGKEIPIYVGGDCRSMIDLSEWTLFKETAIPDDMRVETSDKRVISRFRPGTKTKLKRKAAKSPDIIIKACLHARQSATHIYNKYALAA